MGIQYQKFPEQSNDVQNNPHMCKFKVYLKPKWKLHYLWVCFQTASEVEF